MKFTLKWLKEHLESEASLDEIAHKLAMLGHEVEGIEDPAKALAPFTVAYVKEARQHPNADRLRVCIVDTGKDEVQVVCGAPNARTGMKAVFAPVGSYIPGTDVDLKAGQIRGEASNGMLVSEREMGLSDEHEGIIELDADAPLGARFSAVMGLDDPVLDIKVTPNRGDCLGVHGIARDLAAAGLGTLKPADLSAVPGSFESPVKWRIDLPAEKADACPFVVGRYFRGVNNGPSPKWMQERLRAIGLRPISALVDITNYVTYDLCRPLHVFDAKKIVGDLSMRLAREGEEILALDGETYRMGPEMVVIADEKGLQGIGGVMGGELSGVGEETTDVFLEAALFDPVRVAATGRELGIQSDARYRFERGVDSQSALWAAEVAARLILEICGGEASHVVSAGVMPAAGRRIELRPARVKSLGGVEVPPARQSEILKALGFSTRSNGELIEAEVPSWRNDVEDEACLIEEVLRIHGYDALPAVPLPRQHYLSQPVLTLQQQRVGLARTALAWRGLCEAVTFCFIAEKDAALFAEVDEKLRLLNPISSDLTTMRPSVLPNLARAAARNADRGLADSALFEIGPQYANDTPEGQALIGGGLRYGAAQPLHWRETPRTVDLWDAKGDALAVLEACGAPIDNLQVTRDAPAWYHPGRSGVLRLGPTVLAHFGELHPRIGRSLGLKGPAAVFEVFMDRIPVPKAKGGGRIRPALRLSAFQPLRRDFAFVVSEEVSADKLLRAVKGAEKSLIVDAEIFDLYAGKGVEPGKKSLAVAVTLQPQERTLAEAEIEAIGRKIVAAVEKATGGKLRS